MDKKTPITNKRARGSRSQWYEFSTRRFDGTTQKIARIRSTGLANLFAMWLQDLYAGGEVPEVAEIIIE